MNTKRLITDISVFVFSMGGAAVIVFTDQKLLGILLIIMGLMLSFWKDPLYWLLKRMGF